MTPMLICIPFWEADKGKAFDICRIISGLQFHTGHVGNTAHVLLVARQDCSHDVNMVNIVKERFNVFTFISNSPMRGWPDGPNGMFGQTMIHISNNANNKYECIYWLEPDAVPLCPNWFMDLLNEWRRRAPTVLVAGCRSDCNGDGSGDHITGCALYDPDIARKMPKLTYSSGQAWDYLYRAEIVQVGMHTPIIENFYNQRNADPVLVEDRLSKGVRIIHGFKCRSVVEQVAKKYSIKI